MSDDEPEVIRPTIKTTVQPEKVIRVKPRASARSSKWAAAAEELNRLPVEMPSEVTERLLPDGKVRLKPAMQDALADAKGRSASRRLWERPAAELLQLLQQGRVEVHSAEAAVLLGDLRAALDDVEIPEQHR